MSTADNTVPRYDLDMDGSMEPSSNGRWVRFEDHDAEMTVLINALWKACGDDKSVVEATIASQR